MHPMFNLEDWNKMVVEYLINNAFGVILI